MRRIVPTRLVLEVIFHHQRSVVHFVLALRKEGPAVLITGEFIVAAATGVTAHGVVGDTAHAHFVAPLALWARRRRWRVAVCSTATSRGLSFGERAEAGRTGFFDGSTLSRRPVWSAIPSAERDWFTARATASRLWSQNAKARSKCPATNANRSPVTARPRRDRPRKWAEGSRSSAVVALSKSLTKQRCSALGWP